MVFFLTLMAFKLSFCNLFWRNIVHHFYFFCLYISQSQNVLNLFLFFDQFQSVVLIKFVLKSKSIILNWFFYIQFKASLNQNRLAFSRFLDLYEKKNRLEKLVSLVKRTAWLHASTLQNFARRHFSDVNEVSIVFSWEIDIETGESIEKV